MHTVPGGRASNAFGDPPQGTRHRSRLTHGAATQRDRLVAAMGELVAELGQTTIGVHHVCQRAGISRRTFYDLYADRDGCLVERLERAGMVSRRREGRTNAWVLTARGEEAARTLRDLRSDAPRLMTQRLPG